MSHVQSVTEQEHPDVEGKSKTVNGTLRLPAFRIDGGGNGSEKKAETREVEVFGRTQGSHGRGEFPGEGGISFRYPRCCQGLKRLHLVVGNSQYPFERQICWKRERGSQVTDNKGMGKCSTESRLSLKKIEGMECCW